MAFKLSNALKSRHGNTDWIPAMREYELSFKKAKVGELDGVENVDRSVNDLYFDLVTDFFEYGWGKSFFLAPGLPGESRQQALARHSRQMAEELELKPGMVVSDIGCGIGAPVGDCALLRG